ncbi:MAG: hypothetical protein HOM14_09365 [Gammaproteobacteria bacterium]|jgi:hypothetical protein|nr:hypothetical protein [Gammaproteobacteria bacterium]MBT3724436.1 hypothetical protein [Gammaproteobacteria bacterium]MBT4075396.1 hypothetical protein [Gammaproteobacteria bacterium]MBT4195606.1 hypothetical protein [Gammaproteobacteria bacterium]MBT4450561.1 hypothetical protein [Gammaproteobacteria bacterium]
MRELTLKELSIVTGGESDEEEEGSDEKGLTCEISTHKIGCTGSPEAFMDSFEKILDSISEGLEDLWESWAPAPKPLIPINIDSDYIGSY